MLERFIQRASVVDRALYVVAAPWAPAAVGAFGPWWVGTSLFASRRERRAEARHLVTVRPLLNEEVIELSTMVSALPTTSDIEQARRTREILVTAEQARHRLDVLAGDDDTEAVTTFLGNARYLLQCLTALHRGETQAGADAALLLRSPARAEHTATAVGAKPALGPDGAEREISVCTECGNGSTTNRHRKPTW